MLQHRTLRAVNLLFLLVLCLQVVNLAFLWLPQYIRLILNEVLFVFLPAYLYLRLTRQPAAERIGWKWPGWKAAGLSLLIGMGLYPLAAVLAGVFYTLLGYQRFDLPADAIPSTVFMGVLAIIAYTFMAPLCEEYLFRGVIQPVYARKGAVWAVGFVGLLFVVFHLSLLQGLSIIPLSLALGYVYHRTRSLPASILTHFGANSLAALVLTQGLFLRGINQVLLSGPVIVGGFVLAAAALVALTLITRPAAAQAAAETPVVPAGADPAAPSGRAAWLALAWPVAAAGVIYLGMVISEVNSARSGPPAAPLQVQRAAWSTANRWNYEIRNVLDDVVGSGQCEVLAGEQVTLVCASAVEAYEAIVGRSTFMSSGGTRQDSSQWRNEDGLLLSGSSAMNLPEPAYESDISWTVGTENIEIQVAVSDGDAQNFSVPHGQTALEEDAALLLLPDNTWPWLLAGLDFSPGLSGQVVRFHPYTWRSATQDNGPLVEPRVAAVAGPEEVVTPRGTYPAWKVTLGSDRAAWYALEDPTLVVKFQTGIETWYLVGED